MQPKLTFDEVCRLIKEDDPKLTDNVDAALILDYRKLGLPITKRDVVLDISQDAMTFYVKHYDFARDFRRKRKWAEPVYNNKFKDYSLFMFNA